jgi:hypothetical protein
LQGFGFVRLTCAYDGTAIFGRQIVRRKILKLSDALDSCKAHAKHKEKIPMA